MAKNELLTTLAHAKMWLGIDADSTDTDALLLLLIRAASTFILQYLNRNQLAVREYVEVYDTYGKNWLLLRNYPAHSVSQVYFSGRQITAQGAINPHTNGILLQNAEQINGPQRLTLIGYCFPYERSSSEITYKSGYQTQETRIVPTADPSTVTTSNVWLGDLGVTYEETGIPLVLVSSDPVEGQYAVSELGVYTFAQADVGKEVIILYSYVPSDIEQACYQLVADQYVYKDRIGYKSKALSGGVGETISFTTSDMTDYTQQALNAYIRTVPL